MSLLRKENKKVLDRDSLLKKQELKIEEVDLGNGEVIYIKEMTGRERDEFEHSIMELDKNNKPVNKLDNFRAKLAVCTICDENGELLLKLSDVQTLSNNMGARRLELIVERARELNMISEKDKEELTKNLDPDKVDNSNSDSVGS